MTDWEFYFCSGPWLVPSFARRGYRGGGSSVFVSIKRKSCWKIPPTPFKKGEPGNARGKKNLDSSSRQSLLRMTI